jgi:hypothetical protein
LIPKRAVFAPSGFLFSRQETQDATPAVMAGGRFSIFKKPLFFYDPTAAGGQTTPGSGEGTQENAPDAGDNGSNNQAELDRQFAKRVQRAADSARKELWTVLGVNS